MKTATTIKPEIQQILRSLKCEGSVAHKYEGQLDRQTYKAFDAVMSALGGKWNRKQQGHLFDGDAQEVISNAFTAGEYVDAKKAYELFETPPELAELLVERAAIKPTHNVLEPSAGNGRIVQAIQKTGAKVRAIEINPAHKATLETLLDESDVMILDFLQVQAMPAFNRVCMNPPFSNGQDTAHVRHAYDFLKQGGRLVSIMSPHWTFASDKKATEFRAWAEEIGAVWEELPEGSFKQSGTNVRTVLFEASR